MAKGKKSRSVDQIAGKGGTMTVKGKEYFFAAVRLETLMGEASSVVRSMGIDAIARNVSLGTNPTERRQAVASAAMMSIPITSALEFLNTWEGSLWLIQKSLKEKHPEVLPRDIIAWGYEAVLDAVAFIDGLSGTLEEEGDDDKEADLQGGAANPTKKTDGESESSS